MPASTAGSYNGWSFGQGTSYAFVACEGLFDLPDVRTSDLAGSVTSGVYPGRDIEGGRSVILVVHLYAATAAALQTLVDTVVTATAATNTESTLSLFGGTRTLECRPRRRRFGAFRADEMHQQRWVTCEIEFFASDPTVTTVP